MFSFLKKNSKQFKAGDTLEFGKCSQNNKSIEWIVLEATKKTLLLISKNALITSGYCIPDNDLESLEWVNSVARKVCNDEFYNNTFDSAEKKAIIARSIEQTSLADASGKAVCEDNVFILSEEEVTKYLSEESRKATYGDKYIPWWILPQYELGGKVTLQSGKTYPGIIYPKIVNENGEISYHGRNAYHNDFAIRPCIEINLKTYNKLTK